MKILVISGFLGAGKTTFIKALARKTGKEFAILENEYGSAGIDGDDLRSSLSVGSSASAAGGAAGEVNIWEMAEGCICCSMKGDFAASVLTIANTVDPDYLVIEPTGVAMLSQVMENLQQIQYERILLLAPIAIVDGHSFDRYIREYAALYRDQIASAHTVLVSKMEQASAAERDKLEAALKNINPQGQIITDHYSALTADQWASLLERGYDGAVLQSQSSSLQPSDLPDTFSMKGVSLESPERLFLLMEALIRGACGNVFRAKGQVRAGGHHFRFDVADGLYSITGGTEEPETEDKVVFIGTDLARQKIRRYFFQSTGEIRLLNKTRRMW